MMPSIVTIPSLVILTVVVGFACSQQEDYSECCSVTVGKEVFPCSSVTRTSYCTPSDVDLAQVSTFPMEYLKHTFNQSSLEEKDLQLNVSWSQTIPAASNVQGYVIQLRDSLNGELLCYLVAVDRSVPNGNQVVRAGCLPSTQNEQEICITVFAVSENSNVLIEPKSPNLRNSFPFDTSWPDCAIQSMYHAQRDVLRVSFKPRLGYYNSLLLCNGPDNPPYQDRKVRCVTLSNTEMLQSEVYMAQSPLPEKYFLEMHSLSCRNAVCRYPEMTCSTEVNFTRQEDFAIKKESCIHENYNQWNTRYHFTSISSQKRLSFQLFPSYLYNDSCNLKKFEVNLYKVRGSQDCNTNSQGRQRVFGTHIYHGAYSVAFDNLTPGNYCIRMKPHDSLCGEDGCMIRNTHVTEVVDFVEIPHEVPVGPKPSSGLSDDVVIIIICTAACGVLIASIIIVTKRYRHIREISRGFPKSPPATDIPPCEILKQVSKAQHKPRVLLLYCEEDERLSRIVKSFAKVLECCFHLEVFLPNSIDSICQRMTSGEGEWVIDTIQESDKIIFVSSINALQKAQGKFEQDSVNEELNRIFRSFFHNIINDTKLQFNYDRLYVVRFSFTPSEYVFDQVVPNRYYEIPSSLPSLFMVMHNKLLGDHSLCDTNKLGEYWQKCKQYTTLLAEIDAEHKRLGYHPLPLLRHSRSDTSFCPNKACTAEQRCSLLTEVDYADHLSTKSLGSPTEYAIMISMNDDSKSSTTSSDSGYQKSVSSSGNAHSNC